MKLMDEYKLPVKIRVCDTMGYGVNFPGAVIPVRYRESSTG